MKREPTKWNWNRVLDAILLIEAIVIGVMMFANVILSHEVDQSMRRLDETIQSIPRFKEPTE